MNAAAKLGGYALVLVAALGAGAAAGSAAGPIEVEGGGEHDDAEAHEATGDGDADELPAGGLLVSQDGYTLRVGDRTLDGGPFSFVIEAPGGEPLTVFDELHERELHLIVASRDLRSFAHVHPERDATGRWSVDLPALPPGTYRAFADFQPAGADPLTLGIDVAVPGTAVPFEPLDEVTAGEVGGFDVTVDGDLEAGAASEVTVTVRRDGEVVTTEPYLGAAGHLVALRDGDLAYLHVHPLDERPGGPVRFAVEVPSPGTYALFFDFQVGGEVRTARFVLDAHDHGEG